MFSTKIVAFVFFAVLVAKECFSAPQSGAAAPQSGTAVPQNILSGLTGSSTGTGQNPFSAMLGLPQTLLFGLTGSSTGTGQDPFSAMLGLPQTLLSGLTGGLTGANGQNSLSSQSAAGLGGTGQSSNLWGSLFTLPQALMGQALNTLQMFPLTRPFFSG